MVVRYFLVIMLICLSLFSHEGLARAELADYPDTSLSPFFSMFNVKHLNSAGLDFSPVYYGNDLVFISEKELDLINYGEARFSKLSYLAVLYSNLGSQGDKAYSTPKSFSVHINQLNHNGPITFSADGNYAVFTRTKYEKSSIDNIFRPRLYSAKKIGGKWKHIEQLDFGYDQYFYAHPCLSKDGRELYFTSDREGGLGGYDIYKSVRVHDDTAWGAPINLGAAINSNKNEVFPYFHEDGMLFFSSDGYKGNGGLDIYYSILSSDGQWLTPNHLDANINSGADDFGIIFNDKNDQGFFSSNRDGGKGKDDIYGFFVTWQGSEEKMLEINGRFRFTSLPPKSAAGLDVFLIAEDDSPVEFQKTDVDGYFLFKNLSADRDYQIKTEEKIQQLELELLSSNYQPVALAGDAEGKFLFRRLAYKQFDEVPFLFSPSKDTSQGGRSYKSFEGKLTGSHGKEQHIYAYNEKKEASDSVISDQDGSFSFRQLPGDDAIFFKTNAYYQDMELWVYKDNKKIAEMIQNEKGEFIYVKLFDDIINKLDLEGISASSSLLEADIKGYDLKWVAADKQKQNLSGRFKYSKLPSKPVEGLEVILIDEDNKIITTTFTEDGHFLFRNLPVGKKYIVKIASSPDVLELEMLNINTNNITFISDDEGKFVFRRLSYKDNDDLSYLFGADIDPETEYYTKSFNGQLSGKNISKRRVILLNNDGKEVAVATTNSEGEFKFRALPYSESYIVKLEEPDSGLTLLVHLEDEVVAEMKTDSNGYFVYIELKHAALKRISLMESRDAKMILDDEFTSYASKWVRPTKSTYTISGRFLFKSLQSKVPPKLRVHLINELDEIVQSSESDLAGNFIFQNLPYNKKYVIKIEEHVSGLLLDLLDEKNESKIRLANNQEGKFIYQELTHKDLEFVGFLYRNEKQLDNLERSKSISGQIKFTKLPYNVGHKVYLINKAGGIAYTTTSDLNGVFSFRNLPYKDHYIIKADHYDTNMEILILDGDKVIAELRGNQAGEFTYLKLSYKVAGQIAMMDKGRNSHLIVTRGISGYGEEYFFETAILSDDSKTAYIYNTIKPKTQDELALMQGSTLGLCPETEDLPMEDLDDCIDYTIEELLSNGVVAEMVDVSTEESNVIEEKETAPDSNTDGLAEMDEKKEIKKEPLKESPESSTIAKNRFILYFEFDSERLVPESEHLLLEVITAIKYRAEGMVIINTHTDTQGAKNYNYALSRRRSAYLVKKISSKGISSAKINTKPFGESKPIVKCPINCSVEQHKQNRRAEIIIH